MVKNGHKKLILENWVMSQRVVQSIKFYNSWIHITRQKYL
jgi:hypothetical protein